MSRDFRAFLDDKRKLIERELQSYLKFYSPSRLADAMHYGVMNGGKRIRPILLLAVTELLKGEVEQILPTACAVEMIHSYSLIHDDLPAMDNDDLRRGKPTCHKKFDEATAILAGDTLQAYAYEILAKGSKKAGVSAEKIVKLVEYLGACSGVTGMAGGQMLDLESENKKINLAELVKLHQLKTGALLCFSVTAPAILFDIDNKTRKVLDQYAESIGLAFQIKDDILDVDGSAEGLGKTPGKDQLSEKSTFVKLLGMDKAKKYLIDETNQALDSAIYFGEKNLLIDFAEYLLERKN